MEKSNWEVNQEKVSVTETPLHFQTTETIEQMSQELAPLILDIKDTVKAEEVLKNIFTLADSLAALSNNGTEIWFDEKEEDLKKQIQICREKLGLKPTE